MVSFAASDLTKDAAYKLLTSAIVPRPIAWVSTVSENGKRNLAPFSFFNGVAVMPPTLAFTVASSDNARLFKDTYNNLIATRECVVNIVTLQTAQAMNLTATALPPDVDEFTYAGVTPVPATVVNPPLVQESPVQFECTLNQVVTLANELGRSDLMICNIVYIHVNEAVYLGDYKIASLALNAVGRLGGSEYVATHDTFQLTRRHGPIPQDKE